MTDRTVYLMRGLPACGKSFTARELAGDTGIVLETDQYFYTEVGEDPACYDYSHGLLPEARRWNFERFIRAIEEGISPIVVDRGNGLNPETQQFARYAVDYGYQVELREPESEWWQEIRVLLKYKSVTKEILYQWADRLAEMSHSTHRVPVATIRHWMDKWQHGLTIQDILEYQPSQE
ncbi:MAG: AAA family ATPase [Planctomycetes bacterium]|nr:AAA family ATPase [Planctomycetota bacterium]MBL7040202.1 AAA family ATPase [Pirellulaceae bacterium]